MKKYIIEGGCTFCGTCVFECPEEAITMDDNGASIDQKKCISCGSCYENCASEAVSIIEKKTGGKKEDDR